MRKRDSRLRYSLAGWLLAGMFVAAGYSQAKVQIFDRTEILDEAAAARRNGASRPDTARRGTVYAADGKVLAQSEDAYELGINYSRVPHSPGFFMALAEASGLPEPEISEPALEGRKARVWRQTFSRSQASRVRAVRSQWKADGVSLSPVLNRVYPLCESTAGIIGAVREGKPVAGLELSLNDLLAGRNGSLSGFVDRTGAMLVSDDSLQKAKSNGASVTLTIDTSLQFAATQALRTAVEKHKAKAGSAVVLDPSTGDILAMANWPSYDPADTMAESADFNAAYMGVYEPGSTFKILTLAKALDMGVVTDGFNLYCSGSLKVTDAKAIRCDLHNGTRAHGQTDLEKAIGKSCNVCAATWAARVGRDGMIDYMEGLGILKSTELGLPLERPGLFNHREYAKKLQLANLGFGQSVSVTPVALAGGFAMLANDGVRMEPRLIKKIGSRELEPESTGRVIRAETAHKVTRLMESVIEEDFGTGASLRIPGYRLAGKTGTAQKIGPEGGHVSNFVGFVPAKNPKAVILVMIDAPNSGVIYGGLVAGPVFGDLARAVIRRYGIPPTVPNERARESDGGTL